LVLLLVELSLYSELNDYAAYGRVHTAVMNIISIYIDTVIKYILFYHDIEYRNDLKLFTYILCRFQMKPPLVEYALIGFRLSPLYLNIIYFFLPTD